MALDALVMVLLATPPDRTEVVECVQAFEKAQALVREGALTASKEHLSRCSQASCPPLVQSDCVKLHERLLSDLPSIVVVIRRRDQDVTENVTIEKDGVPAKLTLGLPFELDPGPTTLRATLQDGQSQEQRLAVVVGEKSRRVLFQFDEAPILPKAPAANAWPVALFGGGRALMDLSRSGHVGLGLMASVGVLARWWFIEGSVVAGSNVGFELRAGPRLAMWKWVSFHFTGDGVLFVTNAVAPGLGGSVGGAFHPHHLWSVLLEGSLRYIWGPANVRPVHGFVSVAFRIRWPPEHR